MRIQWKKLLALVILGVTLTAPASAIPIIFDITATVSGRSIFDSTTGSVTQENSLNGEAVISQIIIETDAFAAPLLSSSASFEQVLYRGVDGGPPAISTFLTIGGVTVDTAPYSRDISEVAFLDSRGPIVGCGGECSSMTPDQWAIRTRSDNVGPAGPTALRSFSFIAAETTEPFIPGSGMTWLDFTQPVTLDLLLRLPTASDSFPPRLSLSDSSFECTDRCRQTGSVTTFMTITSLTRTSVPEPGTLGLLVAGFAGVMFAKRRQLALS